MTKQEAISIIASMAKSISHSPAQFHFNVAVTGTQASAHGGGVGMMVSATGGGTGSTTIGYNATMNNPSVEIAMQQANDQINQQMKAVLGILNEIVAELETEQPNASKLQNFLGALKKSLAPNLIANVAASAISFALGIN